MTRETNTPFYRWPTLGGYTTDRGWGEWRWIDRNMITCSVEQRFDVYQFSRFGVVTHFEVAPFVDVGKVFPTFSEFNFRNLHPAGGIAFRAVVRPQVVGHVEVGHRPGRQQCRLYGSGVSVLSKASWRAVAAVASLILLWLLIFMPTLGKMPLIRSEAMYAQIPLEMLESGDWLTPRLNGARYFDKPPLIYWINLLAYKIGGISDNSVRLATFAIGLGEVLATLALGGAAFFHVHRLAGGLGSPHQHRFFRPAYADADGPSDNADAELVHVFSLAVAAAAKDAVCLGILHVPGPGPDEQGPDRVIFSPGRRRAVCPVHQGRAFLAFVPQSPGLAGPSRRRPPLVWLHGAA